MKLSKCTIGYYPVASNPTTMHIQNWYCMLHYYPTHYTFVYAITVIIIPRSLHEALSHQNGNTLWLMKWQN